MNQSKYFFPILFFATTIVYLLGMWLVDVLEVDAAQYASISREMLETGEYLQVKHRYDDYLDKPPLLFWFSALSFKLFGISHFTYRIPSFLFTILGAYSTFKLGEMLYNKKVGQVAALILVTTQSYFLINHDVRTDTILTNAVIFSIWQIFHFINHEKSLNFILGFLSIGLAMLQKGPIGLMTPVIAIGFYLLQQKKYAKIFDCRWIFGLAIAFIPLTPMLWGLYQQWDLHPEKELYGVGNISGVKFFLWDQSFGRLTGDNPFVNYLLEKPDKNHTFFVGTFMWAFIPWTIFSLVAFGRRIKNLVTRKSEQLEWITVGTFLIVFLAFSTSSYKLPHYLFVVFPLVAILSAAELIRIIKNRTEKFSKSIFILQNFVLLCLWLGIALVFYFVFPVNGWLVPTVLILTFVASIYYTTKKTGFLKWIVPSTLTILAANFMLNVHFYPQLTKYQAGGEAAQYLLEHNIDKKQVYVYKDSSHAFDFYAEHIFDFLRSHEALREVEKNIFWVYTNEDGKNDLENQSFVKITETKIFDRYHVTLLTLPFLNKETREETLSKMYLLKIEKH